MIVKEKIIFVRKENELYPGLRIRQKVKQEDTSEFLDTSCLYIERFKDNEVIESTTIDIEDIAGLRDTLLAFRKRQKRKKRIISVELVR